MNRPDDDLDDPQLSRLYQALPDEQPSADTDARLRAAARRAVKAGPGKRVSSLALSRYTATAAALLLGVALTVQWQVREPGQFREAMEPSSVPRREISPAAPAAPQKSLQEMPAATLPAAPDPGRAAPDSTETAPAPAPARSVSPAPEVAANKPEAAARRHEADAAAGVAANTATHAADTLARDDAARVAPLAAAPAPLPPAAPALAPAEKRTAMEAIAQADASHRAREQQAAPEEAARAARSVARPKALREAPAPVQAASAAAPPDYRALMAAGDVAGALAALPAADAFGVVLDRDLLMAAQGSRDEPHCRTLATTAADPGDTALCEGLARRARGQPQPAQWREQMAPAVRAGKAYRTPLVEQLFRSSGGAVIDRPAQ